MGLYRDETGRVLEIDDDFANARGYTPLAPVEIEDINAQRGIAARGEERGAIGTATAALTGAASSLTFGGTDVLLGEGLSEIERQDLAAELEAHPYARAGGEIGGAVAGAFALPGSALARTPAGYLSATAGRAIESGLAEGGVIGTAKALGAMGIEGAAQSAGQYIGHASLEDKEVTAEGLSGALGTGFEFGVVGGGAALGITKGAIAGRRMFSRAMDGRKAAQAAESKWSLASEEALQADIISAQVAETKLNEIRKAKIEAMRYRNEARSMTQEEKLRASYAEPGPVPEEGISIPKEGTPPVEAVTEPVRPSEFASGPPTKVARPAEAPTPKASKGNESASIEGWLAEKRAFDEAELSQARRVGDIEGLGAQRMTRGETIDEIRFNATSDLLSPAIAKEEQRLAEAVEEFQAARKDIESLSKDFAEPQKTAAASPGNRKAVEILDDVHEEALLRARNAGDPSEAGKAISEADELEKLLEHLAEPRLTPGQPLSRGELRAPNAEQWAQELVGDVYKIERYEKASADLVDVLGDQAHPTSVLKAKALRDAERESERKVMDRTARAYDDAESFGPEYKSPKERVRYAREQQLEAQRSLDEIGAQEKEAGRTSAEARKKVREGEKAKKAVFRKDVKAGAQAGKIGAQDIGGGLEILDLPGLPKPSDLPVIGPLLGAYLKFRTLKRAMGRVMGKVPATADNRVAALASQTRDRVARAVDRSLGVLERGGKYSSRIMPPAAGILSHRLYDDGEGAPKKGASIPTLAAARIRELAAYVHTPGAIERDVRYQMRNVTDPDLIVAAEKHRRMIMEYLLRNAPKAPPSGVLRQVDWEPSPAEAMSFARRLDAVSDPAGVFERLAQEQAMLSLEAAEALRENYPKLFSQAQQRLMERAAENRLNVPLRQRIQLSLLYKLPLDAALDPDNLKITQSVYERKPSSPAYNPTVAPQAQAPTAVPAIANPVSISQAFTPAFDRR